MGLPYKLVISGVMLAPMPKFCSWLMVGAVVVTHVHSSPNIGEHDLTEIGVVGFREQQNTNVSSIFCGINAGYPLVSFRILSFTPVGQMEVALKSSEITSISSHCRWVYI